MKTNKILLLALCAVAAFSCNREQGDRFYKLSNASGMEVTVTNFGGRITAIVLPDRDGVKRDVVLGFDKVEDYYPENNQPDFGASIGRYANRIAQGKFTLDGVEYDLPKNNFGHCLHGGPTGWQYQPYKVVEADSRHIKLRMDSPDGDNNFPGAVTAFVTYTLTDDNKIDIAYEATSTAPTIINMTNHSYFNLSGDPANHSICDDELYVNASAFTPVDDTYMTTGEILPVEGTPMDFTVSHKVGDFITDFSFEQLKNGNGYDHNWVLDTNGSDRQGRRGLSAAHRHLPGDAALSRQPQQARVAVRGAPPRRDLPQPLRVCLQREINQNQSEYVEFPAPSGCGPEPHLPRVLGLDRHRSVLPRDDLDLLGRLP